MSAEAKSRNGFGRATNAGACLYVLLVVLCSSVVPPAQAAQSWASEFELKAAFVYNLIPFVEWPAPISGPMVICFAGEGPAPEGFVNFFSGKRAGTREIEVRTVHSGSGFRSCQVVLLAYQDASRTREALAQLSGKSVLSIGEGEGFARAGGVMAFLPSGNTYHLAVNPQAAERAGLKIRSQLMSIATLLSDGRMEP
jgi:hypothetical protein